MTTSTSTEDTSTLESILPEGSIPEDLLKAICDTADVPRERSVSLPGSAYTDPDYHAYENKQIFGKEWISVAHISQLEKAGDFVRVDLAGEPLLIMRGKDDRIRILSRVCRHRGMELMPSGFDHPDEGNRRVILCPYHQWTYDLTGRLIGSPEMHKAEDFDRSEICLHEFPSTEWEGFIFVSFAKNPAPLEEKYHELKTKFLDKWEMGDAKMVWSQKWDCPFNWKILVENFMEAYHHMGAHRKTLEPFLPARGCYAEPLNENYSAMHLPLKKSLAEEIEDSGEAGTPLLPFKNLQKDDYKEWWVFLGFPNFLLFVAPDRMYWYRLIPTGPESCELLTTMLVAPESLDMENFETVKKNEVEAAITFHSEDMEVCTATQRGMRSRAHEQGRLSHLEEPIWQFQQYLARCQQNSSR